MLARFRPLVVVVYTTLFPSLESTQLDPAGSISTRPPSPGIGVATSPLVFCMTAVVPFTSTPTLDSALVASVNICQVPPLGANAETVAMSKFVPPSGSAGSSILSPTPTVQYEAIRYWPPNWIVGSHTSSTTLTGPTSFVGSPVWVFAT